MSISVKVIKDSMTEFGYRVTTFELEYPRLIHSEFMTHRVFSRNAASSRAIPIEKMIEQATQNTVFPVWTHNKAGMQGDVVKDGKTIHRANEIMLYDLLAPVIDGVKLLEAAGIHKQNANRYLEPFQHIKTVLTVVELDNFFKLRFHPDAQAEIRLLAQAMLAEYSMSVPDVLKEGEWHLPYADKLLCETNVEAAKEVSASCCAQVSYRKNDSSVEKAELVYDRLVGGDPVHASPFEHQVRPLIANEQQRGNLRGFHQLRQDIEDDKTSCT